ncbi:beta-propeller fold lactonase family protein, partial [Bacillus cereus]
PTGPTGSFAYVANESSNTVSVIDTSTNLVTTTITVGLTPFSVAITPDGSFAYVVNADDDNVSVIDTSTNMVTTTVTVGTYPLSVTI